MEVTLPYGRDRVAVRVPDRARVLAPALGAPLPDPGEAVRHALEAPVDSPPLADIVRRKASGTACIVVSDSTRPVPYPSILPPLLACLEASGLARERVLILIATGMHRSSTLQERIETLGEWVCSHYRVEDHDATDQSSMVALPRPTRRGTTVHIDRRYAEADIKITTGLVEPHFMAGFSGGRKSICPGIVDLQTIQKFHGPAFLEDPCASTGILVGNPCHEEATDVALTAGVDFILNVTLNLDRETVGVYAGDLRSAFEAATREVERHCVAEVAQEADIVLTSAGGYPLDQTFYQATKGMVGALPAVKDGGRVIVAAKCQEGIGSPEFRRIMFAYSGMPERFIRDISENATVEKDQWGFEMQVRALRKVGMGGLVLCTDGIPPEEASLLTVSDARAWCPGAVGIEHIQKAVDVSLREAGADASVVVIPEGPYVMARRSS